MASRVLARLAASGAGSTLNALRTDTAQNTLARELGLEENDDRIRAHVFLCMRAYYVERHMRRALAPLVIRGYFGSPIQKSSG